MSCIKEGKSEWLEREREREREEEEEEERWIRWERKWENSFNFQFFLKIYNVLD